MPPIDVVCDASVVLKWFRTENEDEVDASRALLDLHIARRVALFVLDLTAYEIGNALVRGLRASADDTAAVLGALDDICPRIAPTPADFAIAATLAERHGLTVYDAAYAAVAASRHAQLATVDHALLDAGLGRRVKSPESAHRGRRALPPVSRSLSDVSHDLSDTIVFTL